MADLTVQTVSAEDGVTLAMAAASAGGDKFVWDAQAGLLLRNGGGVSVTITIAPAAANIETDQGDLTRSPLVLVLAAGATGLIPPMPSAFRNRADLDKVSVSYSSVASLFVLPLIVA
jgi:hypothetical protein